MYFDTHIYRKVLAYAWAQKHWPRRNAMMLRLIFFEPLFGLFQNFFLLIDYLFFPALWKQNVVAPIFIVGHARSGTTLMHRLMAADGDRFSYFLYWEMFFPSLTLRKLVGLVAWIDATLLADAIQERLREWDERTFAPYRHMHDMSLWNPEEDQFVMNGACVTQQWQLNLPMMHVLDIFHVDRLTPERRKRWFRYYRECVKRQLVRHGGHKTHLSKNPLMCGWVGGILEAFPDARFVVMVRDPVQCIPSTLKLMETNWEGKGWSRDDYLPALREMTEICFESFDFPRTVLEAHPETPQSFVDYRDLTGSPRQTVEEVYAALGLEISPSYADFLKAQEEKEKRHASRFEYSIDEYEIDSEEIEKRLAAHYDRFHWPRSSERDETEATEVDRS